MKMELVEGLLACVEANAMRKYRDETISHQSDGEEMPGKRSRKSRRLGLLKHTRSQDVVDEVDEVRG